MCIQEKLIEWFNIDPNTSATIIISLSVFIVGFLFQQLFQSISFYIQRKRTRNIFEIVVKKFIEQVNVQSKVYSKSAKTFVFDRDTSFQFRKATIFTSQSVNQIGYQNIYNAYFSGFENLIKFNKTLKLKAFNKIWSCIISVDFWLDKSFKGVDMFPSKYNGFNDNRAEALENYRKFLDPLMASFDGKEIPKGVAIYISEIDRINIEWQKSRNRLRPDKIHRKLILPLRIYNRKNINPISVEMNSFLLDATRHYINQSYILKMEKLQQETYSKSFNFYSKISSKAIDILTGSS